MKIRIKHFSYQVLQQGTRIFLMKLTLGSKALD